MYKSKKGNRDSRSDFERELNILGENIMNGRITISNHLRHLGKEITKARHAPNKRINLLTINEMIRTFAMSANFHDLRDFETESDNENER
ncbi:hypothetical protein IX39_08695 [Chryseobacterium formosense]|uniref:Uncharacterized protein n=1 Tax=Chryseobacterium formosense TaxID=236814 RepID=A0A085Z8C8_9FLAO|nr:hypothetical protein [Chryseobacterium formosense]KFF00692.1 hypothetical protein IX39_08695 [Chryseobacterium formosense]SFT36696.1 hypothetical protein SAMN05421857_0435 [Chryseobacterium formosense]